jgi:hypothetical protein
MLPMGWSSPPAHLLPPPICVVAHSRTIPWRLGAAPVSARMLRMSDTKLSIGRALRLIASGGWAYRVPTVLQNDFRK